MKKIQSILSLAMIFLATSVFAAPVKDKYVAVELIPEVSSVAAGDTFTVALKVTMDDGWHTYWKNPGLGMPIKIRWSLPEGVTAGDIQWPTPKVYDNAGVVNYGYSDEAWLLTNITLPEGFKEKSLALNAKVSWLMCKGSCVPGRAKVSTSVDVSKSVMNNDLVDSFKTAREKIPQVIEGWSVTKKSADAKSVTLALKPSSDKAAELKDVYFFVEQKKVIDSDAKQILKKVGGGYELTLTNGKKPLPETLSGILSAKSGFDTSSHAYQISVAL
jgi:thiol:disulfide interchange protein DsbD